MSYFGSVRFFKHLILTVLAIIIIFPYILALHFFYENMELRKQADNSNEDISCIKTFDIDELFLKTAEASEQFSGKRKVISSNHEIIPYQSKYDDLYVDRQEKVEIANNKKVAYLTFDDGPSKRTLEILDILDYYNIKATFFVTNQHDNDGLNIYKEIVSRGHTIGVHSYSHIYKEIYSSVENYLDDFYKMYEQIYKLTGVKPDLYRFAGGSINSYNAEIYQDIIAEMTRRGFTYHDWNVISGDTHRNVTKNTIINSIVKGIKDNNKIVILMHDSIEKKCTSESLPEVIKILKTNGYSFDKLDGTVKPYIFGYIE